MSNTPNLSWTDLPGVRSCPIDGWRKTLQILQTVFCPYNVCVGQPSTHVLPRSKEESKRTSFHSLFLHRSIGHDLTPGMSMDMTQIGCTGQPSNSVVGHWTNIELWQTEWKTTSLATVQLCEFENQTLEALVAGSCLYAEFNCSVVRQNFSLLATVKLPYSPK